jgi:hypothetical protein
MIANDGAVVFCYVICCLHRASITGTPMCISGVSFLLLESGVPHGHLRYCFVCSAVLLFESADHHGRLVMYVVDMQFNL